MTRRLGIAAGLAMLLGSAPGAQSQQTAGSQATPHDITFGLRVSVEDKPELPANSKVEWKGTSDGCTGEQGNQLLHPAGSTQLTIRTCKVRLLIFVTGYDTKQVVTDLTDPNR